MRSTTGRVDCASVKRRFRPVRHRYGWPGLFCCCGGYLTHIVPLQTINDVCVCSLPNCALAAMPVRAFGRPMPERLTDTGAGMRRSDVYLRLKRGLRPGPARHDRQNESWEYGDDADKHQHRRTDEQRETPDFTSLREFYAHP